MCHRTPLVSSEAADIHPLPEHGLDKIFPLNDISTFSSFMNHVRFAGGWDCQDVQRASKVSPIWYFSFIPVILGFSSGRSMKEEIKEILLENFLENFLCWTQTRIFIILHGKWLKEAIFGDTYRQLAYGQIWWELEKLNLPQLHNYSFRNYGNWHSWETMSCHQTTSPWKYFKNLILSWKGKKISYINIKIVKFKHFSWRCFICDEPENFKVSSIPLDCPHFVSVNCNFRLHSKATKWYNVMDTWQCPCPSYSWMPWCLLLTQC